MARKQKREPSQSAANKRHRYIVAGVILLGVIMMIVLLPSKLGKNGNGTPPTAAVPQLVFAKNGELTFMSARNEFIGRIDIEIAASEEKRELGLMGRAVMDERQGMLFIFDEVRPVSFWMKNTILSLDMLMVNENKEIVTIHKNTTPYSEQTYPSSGPVKYVVELVAGATDRLGVKVGDRISWQRND
jgi:uncharacterized protein